MFSRRNLPTWFALVAMVFAVSQPAWGICIGCQRSSRGHGNGYSDGHDVVRSGLFAGRTRGGGLFQRASYGSAGGEGRYHSGYGSAGGQGRYEAGCGQSYEAGCGQAAEAACGESSNAAPVDDYGSREYEVDDLSAQVPSKPIAWRVQEIELPRPTVRWRVQEIVKFERPSAPVVAVDSHYSQ